MPDDPGQTGDGAASQRDAAPREDGPAPGSDAGPGDGAGIMDLGTPGDSLPRTDLPQPVNRDLGSLCDPTSANSCKAGLTCMVVKWGAPNVGFCTKRCSAGGEPCSGGPPHTLPYCVLLDKEQRSHCGFVCDYKGYVGPCPAGTHCVQVAGMGLCVP
jgi:hypothetical protein